MKLSKILKSLILISMIGQTHAQAQTHTRAQGGRVNPATMNDIFNLFPEEATLSMLKGIKAGTFKKDEIFILTSDQLFYPGTSYRFAVTDPRQAGHSDAEGVCKVLGYAGTLSSGAIQLSSSEETFNTLSVSDQTEVYGAGKKNAYLQSLVCIRKLGQPLLAAVFSRPQLNYPGTKFKFNQNSDVNGICGLMGYSRALPFASITEPAGESRLITVSASGEPVHISKASESFSSVACLTVVPTRTESQKIIKISGSELHYTGTLFLFSAVGEHGLSSGKRVCRTLGFKEYLSGSAVNQEYSGTTLSIDEQGNTNTGDKAGTLLVSIMCK